MIFATNLLTPLMRSIFFLVFITSIPSSQQLVKTNEITSNTMYQCSGNADTVWVLTSKGINLSTTLKDPSPVWSGIKILTEYPFDIASTFGSALVCLSSSKDPNNLLYIQQSTFSTKTISLPYQIDNFIDTSNQNFLTIRATKSMWYKGYFWTGCVDGGLLQIDTLTGIKSIIYPGIDSTLFTFQTFIPKNIPLFGKPQNRIIGLVADTSKLYVLCEKALWSMKFNSLTPQWTRISDSLVSVTSYVDISQQTRDSSTILYVLLKSSAISKLDTSVYCYTFNTGLEQWHKFIDPPVRIVRPGPLNRVYAIDYQNRVSCFKDTLYNPTIPLHEAYCKTPHISYQHFTARMRATDPGIISYSLFDVHAREYSYKQSLYIATDVGLFYSTNELLDESTMTQFKLSRRNIPVASALSKVYAVPGIINGLPGKTETVFAYNLEKDDFVTIDIYDFNMDHVIRIIDHAFRRAGTSNSSGRSTQPSQDRWSGLNSSGRPVSPGVYYFKITTKKGYKNFGKVIIAKN